MDKARRFNFLLRLFGLVALQLIYGISDLFAQMPISGPNKVAAGVVYYYEIDDCNAESTYTNYNFWTVTNGVFISNNSNIIKGFNSSVRSVGVKWNGSGNLVVQQGIGGPPYQCGGDVLNVTAVPVVTTTVTPAGAYCDTQQVTLSTNADFGSYTWQYRIETGTWQNFGGSVNSITFDIDDIFGSNYASNLSKNIYFRCTVDGGNPDIVNGGITGAYVFLPDMVLATGASGALAPICAGGSNGSIGVVSFSRAPLSGETFTYEVHSSPDLNPSSLVNGNAVGAGTYYVLASSNFGGCGSAVFKDVTVPVGPRTGVSGSAAVTSDYNGSNVKCNGGTDGVITITSASGGNGGPYQYSINGGGSWQTGTTFSVGAGTYSNIKIKDGCATATIGSANTVNVTQPLAVSVSSLVPSWCNTLNNGSVTITGSGGTGAYRYSLDLSADQGSNVFTGLATGATHSVVIKDVNDCVSSASTVFVPAPLAGSPQVTNPICGTDTGSIQINSAAGGTAPYSYQLNSGSFVSTNVFPGLLTSNNTVTLKDSKNCTVAFTGQQVTIPPAINVTAVTTKVTCLGGSDGTITATAVNTVGSVEYSLDGGSNYQSQNLFTSKPIGSAYIVTVRDGNSCVKQSAPIIVSQQPTLTGTVNETVSILCHGDTGVKGASLDLTPTGGPSAGTYSYEWSSSTTTNFASTEDVSQLPAGMYSVKISKDICSTTLPNIIINEPAVLSSSIVKTDVSCNVSHGAALSSNGSINLTPSGGTTPYAFSWSNTAISEDLSNLVSGTYDVTITDAHGCETTNGATLIEPATVSSSIASFTDVTCNGFDNGVITMAAVGGSSIYSYSLNGGTGQPSATFSSLPPGDYTIDVKDSKGCSSQTNNQSIVEPDELLISTGDIVNTTCGNSNGSATSTTIGGTLPYSYRWEDVSSQLISTAANLSSAAGGTYNVIVTDQNNCTNTALALISSSDGPQIQRNSITATTCFNSPDGKADVTISAGVAPYRVSWNNGETGTTPVGLFPGNNIITVKDDHDCVVVELVNVPHPDPVAIDTKIITAPTCPGSSDAAIALTSKGGSGVYTYAWANGNTTAGINNVPAGDYGVTIKDSKLCTLVTSVKVDAIPDLKLRVTSSQLPTCFGGSDGSLTVSATGGNGTYSYLWANNTTGPLLNKIAAGPYTVKVTDVRGCTGSSEFVLDNPVKFVFNIEDKTICVGQKYKLVSEVANGTYRWSSGNGFSSTQREVILTDPGTYKLQVTNEKGCFAEDSFELKTSRDLLHADMLMVTEAFEKDTVVVIDLSWPLPDASTWIFPTQAAVIEENAQLGYAFIQFDRSGGYDVSLQVSLGECVDKYSQMITILGGERPGSSGGRQRKTDLIRYVEVYPNPNKGEFEIEAELTEIAPARMLIVNMEGNRVLVNKTDEGKSSYKWQVTLPEVNQGTYFIVLKAGDETKAIRMLKL